MNHNMKDIQELESNSSKNQLDSRKKLEDMFINNPLPAADLMSNMGLYLRSSALVKYLVINDLYERILNIPGVIVEFGVWWGQNLVLFENLRAIHEPFNKTRNIIGFDTFEGYTGFSDKDAATSNIIKQGSYSTPNSYEKYLKELLTVHEGCNVLGHVQNCHKLIKGDVTETTPKFFQENPGTIVSLAYFDMGLYQPTKAALEAILPHMVPGSIVLMDELTWEEASGEAIAFKEVFKNYDYSIEKSRFTPMRSIITLK